MPLDFLREDERHAVLREGERAAPVQVTRILVEDDDFSEAATRGFAPVTEFACRCLPPDVGKAGADIGVKSIAFREPPRLGFRAEPVVKDSLRVMTFSFFGGGWINLRTVLYISLHPAWRCLRNQLLVFLTFFSF